MAILEAPTLLPSQKPLLPHQLDFPCDTIEDTAHPVLAPWKPHPVTIEVSPSLKEDTVIKHITLLQHLWHHKQNVIAYTNGSQLDSNIGVGYYIPRGLIGEV
jgi:hypothetical protein